MNVVLVSVINYVKILKDHILVTVTLDISLKMTIQPVKVK